jgi:16S rRNA (cytidine1402-2'-O)-methyltransferase
MVRPGRLFVVSTPIGHLGDFSFRGVEVLKQVAVVAAEDTRRTRKLLAHYGIPARVVSLHAHSRPEALERFVDRVEAGDDAAYVTDAGTPGLSDPGGALADAAHRRGLTVVPVPGASALLAALAASGLPADRFVFLGFLPRRGSGRGELLERVAREPWTSVCYEAPGRTAALLADLAAHCGPGREAVVGRELTKLHEEVRRGTLGDLAAYYAGTPPRGEVTVVVAGRAASEEAPGGASADDAVPDAAALIAALRADGLPPGGVAKELARRLGIPRQDAYRLLTR